MPLGGTVPRFTRAILGKVLSDPHLQEVRSAHAALGGGRDLVGKPLMAWRLPCHQRDDTN